MRWRRTQQLNTRRGANYSTKIKVIVNKLISYVRDTAFARDLMEARQEVMSKLQYNFNLYNGQNSNVYPTPVRWNIVVNALIIWSLWLLKIFVFATALLLFFSWLITSMYSFFFAFLAPVTFTWDDDSLFYAFSLQFTRLVCRCVSLFDGLYSMLNIVAFFCLLVSYYILGYHAVELPDAFLIVLFYSAAVVVSFEKFGTVVFPIFCELKKKMVVMTHKGFPHWRADQIRLAQQDKDYAATYKEFNFGNYTWVVRHTPSSWFSKKTESTTSNNTPSLFQFYNLLPYSEYFSTLYPNYIARTILRQYMYKCIMHERISQYNASVFSKSFLNKERRPFMQIVFVEQQNNAAAKGVEKNSSFATIKIAESDILNDPVTKQIGSLCTSVVPRLHTNFLNLNWIASIDSTFVLKQKNQEILFSDNSNETVEKSQASIVTFSNDILKKFYGFSPIDPTKICTVSISGSATAANNDEKN